VPTIADITFHLFAYGRFWQNAAIQAVKVVAGGGLDLAHARDIDDQQVRAASTRKIFLCHRHRS
jgi:hypothetical protein